MALVSVLLTSYNHEKYVGESIESILNQTFTDFELVIVDDCSSDHSWEVIQGYRDARIHAMRAEKNTNCEYAVATMKRLQGKYIAMAHCDDKWDIHKLEKQVAYMENNSECAACFTLVKVIGEDGEEKEDSNFYVQAFTHENRTRFEWLRKMLYDGCCFCHPSILIRNEAYKNYDLYTYGLDSIPDYCKWIRLCIHADVHVIQEKLAYFRSRDKAENTSGDSPEKHFRNVTEMYFVLREFLAIKKQEDFIAIFPEADRFVVNGEIVIEYAFAQILLSTMSLPVYHMFAMQVIYDLFQNDSMREKLKRLYGYDRKAFDLEKQKMDIFGIIQPQQYISKSYLHMDMGEGYSDEYKLEVEKTYVNSNGEFFMTFSCPLELEHKQIRQIRIDLGKEDYRKYYNLKIFVNGKEMKWERGKMGSLSIVFPEFYVFIPEGCVLKEVLVIGRTSPLSKWEIRDYYIKTEEKMRYIQEKNRMHNQSSIKKVINSIKNKGKC